jgi:ribonuclease HI
MGEALKQVSIYTDGACLGNPGPGGYGVVLLYGEHRKELSGGFRLTTSSRMEIKAAIAGVRALKYPCAVTLYSDSKYVVDAMTKGWAKRWQANGWKRNKKDKAMNPDLWGELLQLCEPHEIQFEWVKGHAGNVENERCDGLAVEAARQPELSVDNHYEEAQNPSQLLQED